MTKVILAFTTISLMIATPSLAIQRQQTMTRTCAEVQALVRAQGEVILQYRGRSGLQLYDRAVADRDSCSGSGYGQQTYMPAKDRKDCAVTICQPNTDLRP
jgi:hypothetical protein